MIRRITDYIGYLRTHRFVQSTVWFQLGTAGAMFVQAAAGVVLARVLGPDDYGTYAIVMSLAAIGSVLLGAGAADAMAPVLSRAHHGGDDAGVRNALLFLGKFVVISGGIVILISMLAVPLIGRLYAPAVAGYTLAVLAAAAVSTLLFVPATLAAQVFGRIRRLAALTFADQFVRQGIVVALVLMGAGLAGAATGHLLGALVIAGACALQWNLLRRSHPSLPSVFGLWRERPADGRKFIAPTLWVLADRNLAMLYGAAPVAVAGLFLTTAEVSYFKVALGWTTLALSLLGPVSTLLNTELARIQAQQAGRLRAQFVRVTAYAIGVSAALTLAAAVVARPVFGLLYGAAYLPAVPLVYWLVPFGALFGLGVALGPMWRALDRVRVSIGINLLVLGAGVPLGVFALRHWGAYGAVAMVTAWYTVSHAASFAYLLRHLNRSDKMRTA